MFRKKELLQEGVVAQEIIVVIEHDRNGKQHLFAFQTMEDAKRYSDSQDKRIVKLWKIEKKS